MKKDKILAGANQNLTKTDLENIYLGLQLCNNNASVQPAVILYCRTIKKKALILIQEFETELESLMEEYKVPKKSLLDGGISYDTTGMRNANAIDALVAEFNRKTFKIENLNALTQIEFIKHTRGLSEDQMDILEKYLVKP